METEILTADGWKTHETLRTGDRVLTLNHETGQSEWQECQEVCLFEPEPREMVRIRTRGHSSLTTPDHRWPVERHSKRTGRRSRIWVTSSTFHHDDHILMAAQSADRPVEAIYDDAFVELVAWFWTEGHAPRGQRYVLISQKKPEGCDRIRRALEKLLGPAYEQGTYHRKTDEGAWIEQQPGGGARRFRIAASHGQMFRDAVEDHVVKTEFLMALTAEQLDLFIEVSLMADGSNARSGQQMLGQKRLAAAERFQLACILAGRSATLHQRVYKRDGYVEWLVSVGRKVKSVPPVKSMRQKSSASAVIESVTYDGVVWCPRTPNQTWMARRDGTVYFTGNTINKGRTEINEPPVDGGDDPVIIDRQNLVLVKDLARMSDAQIAKAAGGAAGPMGGAPPGGETPDGSQPPGGQQDDAPGAGEGAGEPAESVSPVMLARYRARLREALASMPVAEAGGDAGRAVYAQLAGDFPPSAISWVKDDAAGWSGPRQVPLDQIGIHDSREWDAERPADAARIAAARRKLRRKLAAGRKPKPAILIRWPGAEKWVISDGHHRFVAAQREGLDSLWAYTGKVPQEKGRWLSLAMHERRGKAKAA